MIAFFKITLYIPLYNTLVFLTGVIPGGDIGLAIIILTLAIKIILFPLQHRATKTQKAMKEVQGKMNEIKEKHKDNREEQGRQMLALYKEHGIKPFGPILLILIQLPILLSLFWVFRNLPFDSSLLYSFVELPDVTNEVFLGLFDLGQRSILLAIMVGASQYFQIKLATPPLKAKKPGDKSSLQDDLARSMNMNMKYVMPVIVAFVAASLPSAISLYWLVSNLFMVGHELIVKRRALRVAPTTAEIKPS